MPQDILATCNGCGKKLSIKHAISCPKGDLVLAWHDDATKEWGALGARALVPSSISYKTKKTGGQWRGRGPGLERSRKDEQPTAAQKL